MKSGIGRIAIDGRMVGERLSGVGRTVVSLAKGLAELPRLDYEPVFICAAGMQSRFAGFETIEARTPYLDAKEMLTIPIILHRQRAKLYHSPSHSSLVSAPCPWLLTLHDLIDLRSGGVREQIYYEGIVRPFAMRAKKIVTVSETSRASLQQWLGPKPSIETVFNAVDPAFLKPAESDPNFLSRYELQKGKFIVALSNAKPHKNVGILVRAFHQLRERRSTLTRDWRLVVTMKEYANEPGVIALGSVDDGQARSLLQNSAALAFPSLVEGFGLPPLEAAVLGVPVILSDIAAHREIFQGVGPSEFDWVNPESVEGWEQAMERALSGKTRPCLPGTRSRLAELYSVRKQGEHMDRIYRAVLDLGS